MVNVNMQKRNKALQTLLYMRSMVIIEKQQQVHPSAFEREKL
jgi:hypothetical protein